MKFYRRANRKQDSGKGKKSEKIFKEKDKRFSKGKKINCFNCGGLGHISSDCLSPKDIKKSMLAAQSDIDSNLSDSIASKDTRYDQSDFLAFVASIDSMDDSESDCEFNDEENAEFLENMVHEYKCLIKKFMKVNNVVNSQKSKIDMLNKEKINHIEKIRFLETKYQSLLERNDTLT